MPRFFRLHHGDAFNSRNCRDSSRSQWCSSNRGSVNDREPSRCPAIAPDWRMPHLSQHARKPHFHARHECAYQVIAQFNFTPPCRAQAGKGRGVHPLGLGAVPVVVLLPAHALFNRPCASPTSINRIASGRRIRQPRAGATGRPAVRVEGHASTLAAWAAEPRAQATKAAGCPFQFDALANVAFAIGKAIAVVQLDGGGIRPMPRCARSRTWICGESQVRAWVARLPAP